MLNSGEILLLKLIRGNALPVGSQSSTQLRSVAEADGIAVLPEEQGSVAEGDRLDVVPLRGLL